LYLVQDEVEEIGKGDIYLQLTQRSFKLLARHDAGELCSRSLPIPLGHQTTNSFEPRMIKSTLKVMNSISNESRKVFKGLSIRKFCKLAFDKFASSVRIYIGSNDQSFFQETDSGFDILNVLVGPFDLETCTPVGGHGAHHCMRTGAK